MTELYLDFDPKYDLRLERTVDVKAELVWAAWTTPEHILHWFTPAPWKTIDCEIDLKPGGIFRTVMQSPEGEEFPGTGCFLDVVENRRLIWTSAMKPSFRPTAAENKADMLFTAIIAIEPAGEGTKYTATVIHGSEEDRKKHEEMGFEHGWGAALDQLVAYMKGL
ncbi:MAG: SRPBCC family protein [Pyrinomonadaceae bacterium]